MLLSGLSIAQQFSQFQRITTNAGLPSNYVFSMTDDASGFFWIGTDKGLARFDGFRWEVFTTDHGLPGNYITKVVEADKHGVWVVVSTKGLYYYNVVLRKSSLITDNLYTQTIERTSQGDLFFSSVSLSQNVQLTTGIVIHNTKPHVADTVFTYNLHQNNSPVFADVERRQLVVYHSATSMPAPAVKMYNKEWSVRLSNYNIPSNSLLHKVNDSVFKNTSSIYFIDRNSGVKEIKLFDNNNTYLHAMAHKGEVLVWNEENGVYAVNDNGVTAQYGTAEGLDNLSVTDVFWGKNGQLLMSTLGSGIYHRLPNGNRVLQTGDWPVKGLAVHDNFGYAVSAGYLLVTNMSTGKSNRYAIDEKDVQNVDVYDSIIFVSSLSGISCYRPSGNALVREKKLPHNAGISGVVKWKDTYYAGAYGDKMQRINSTLSSMQLVTNTPFVAEGIQTISSGIASFNYEDGLALYRNDSTLLQLTTKQGLPSNAVYHVHEYADTLWVSTAKGIAAFKQGKWVQTLDASNGIPNTVCRYAFHDKHGRFYVVSDKNLLVESNGTFSTLSTAAIVQDKFDHVTACEYHAPSNTLMVATLHHLYSIQMDQLADSKTLSSPLLMKVLADGEQMPPHESFTLPSHYGELQFHFQPIDANPFYRPAIYYKLQGYQSSFVQLTDSLSVKYARLRKGNYSLVARSLSPAGVWSEETVVARFRVKPSFTESVWFAALLSAIAVVLAFAIAYMLQIAAKRKAKRRQSMNDMLEQERERISKELHDHLGTALVTMVAQTDGIEQKLMLRHVEEGLQKTRQLSEQTRDTMNVLRETIWAVQESSHTIDEFAMRTRNFLQRILSVNNIEWRLELNGDTAITLTAQQTLQLFRIIQECMQNIVKHANASFVEVHIRTALSALSIIVNDNGKGFDSRQATAGNGLPNMHNRIALLQGQVIVNSSEKGTTVAIECPIIHV